VDVCIICLRWYCVSRLFDVGNNERGQLVDLCTETTYE
jgi:hypothetical protein